MAKTLDYDFTDPQFDGTTGIEAQTGPTLTVTRAADATVMDYFNVLKTVGDNEPRFTGGRRVENLCLQSNDLSTTWVNVDSTDSQNVAGQTNPLDGAADVNSINENGAAATTHDIYNSSMNLTDTRTGVFSVYLKASNRSWANLVWLNRDNNSHGAYFNLSTGAVGTTSGTDFVDAGSEDVGNGWYRCWLAAGAGVGVVNDYVRIRPATGDVGAAFDGLSQESILVYGAQFEDVSGQDDPSPSAYIATTTVAKAQWYATKRRTNIFGTIGVTPLTTPDDLTPAAKANCTITYDSGDGYSEITTTSASGAYWRPSTTTAFQNFDYGKSYTWSAQIRGVGSAIGKDVSLCMGATGDIPTYTPATLTSEWQTVSFERPAKTNAAVESIYCDLNEGSGSGNLPSGAVIQVKDIQFENTTSQTDKSATAYIAATMGEVTSSSFDTAITPTGLLIEEERTNLLTWTESFDNAAWTATRATISAEATTAPDGTLTADSLDEDGTAFNSHLVGQSGITLASSTTYCLSCYLKASNRTWATLSIVNKDNVTITTFFNLSAGSVGTESAGVIDSGIEDVGNGWYRCWFTGDSGTGATGPRFEVTVAEADNDVVVSGLSQESLFMWGADLQLGSFPTSYIPNDSATASVTRAADLVETTDVTWLNGVTDTWYCHASVTQPSLAKSNLLSVGPTRDAHLFCSTSQIDFYRTESVYPINAGTITANTLFRVAVGVEENNVRVIVDGGTPVDDSASSALTKSGTRLRVGYFDSEGYANGHIARIVYYDERLSDTQLEDLSNGTFPVAFGYALAGGTGLSLSLPIKL